MEYLVATTPGTSRLGARDAFANRKRPNAHWADAITDADGNVFPTLHPSFSFTGTETVFTIGSCFARNIEEVLAKAGCHVPMLDFTIPTEEWEHRPAGVLNTFTPPNFKDTLAWTARVFDRGGVVHEQDCKQYMLARDNGMYMDIGIAAQVPVSLERLVERRQQIYDIFKYAFLAELVIMTPGYVEAWYDAKNGIHMAGVLKMPKALHSDRFQFEVRPYEDCVADLLAAIDIIRLRNPASKFIISASPVPLATTFTGEDVRVANMRSKAVVRAVCATVAERRENVDYFPSYECANLSNPANVWKADRIHIHASFIAKIVKHMLAAYFPNVTADDLLTVFTGPPAAAEPSPVPPPEPLPEPVSVSKTVTAAVVAPQVVSGSRLSKIGDLGRWKQRIKRWMSRLM